MLALYAISETAQAVAVEVGCWKTGRTMIQTVGAFAEFERATSREHTSAGLTNACEARWRTAGDAKWSMM